MHILPVLPAVCSSPETVSCVGFTLPTLLARASRMLCYGFVFTMSGFYLLLKQAFFLNENFRL